MNTYKSMETYSQQTWLYNQTLREFNTLNEQIQYLQRFADNLFKVDGINRKDIDTQIISLQNERNTLQSQLLAMIYGEGIPN
jgi:hypothetical protein